MTLDFLPTIDVEDTTEIISLISVDEHAPVVKYFNQWGIALAVILSLTLHVGTAFAVFYFDRSTTSPLLVSLQSGVTSIDLHATLQQEQQPTQLTKNIPIQIAKVSATLEEELLEASPLSSNIVSEKLSNELPPLIEKSSHLVKSKVVTQLSPHAIATRRIPTKLSHQVALATNSPPLNRKPLPPPEVVSSTVASSFSQGAKVDSLPQKHYSPAPIYPAEALQARLTGRVVLRVKVDSDGGVTSAVVYRSSGYSILDQAAITSVKRWKFQPAKRFGIAVEHEIAVPVRFTIPD